MADDGGNISIADISAQKLQNVTQQAQVSVFKKQLDQQGEVTTKIVESATERTLPEGVGGNLNTAA